MAAEWYRKAAEGGYLDAMFNLGDFYRNGHGVPKDEAISMITRGFVDIDIPGLPGPLRDSIDAAIAATAAEAL